MFQIVQIERLHDIFLTKKSLMSFVNVSFQAIASKTLSFSQVNFCKIKTESYFDFLNKYSLGKSFFLKNLVVESKKVLNFQL